jgi:hypothetical protein
MESPNGRYFINDKKPLPKSNYHEELIESLTRINLHNPPVHTCSTGWRFQGFFQGPTSIAYLFYKLSIIYPDLEFKGQSFLDWARAYLALSTFGPKQAVDPDHCGIANETLASLALNAVVSGDASLAQQLCSYRSIITGDEELSSDEWLYGRAGYLYFLRLIRSHFRSHNSLRPMIDSTIEMVVERILRSPKPFTWHGKAYLGAAHGSIGIVAQLMLSVDREIPTCEKVISHVLKLQFESGNFPSSLGPEQSDELVQFCHGAPGFVVALQSVVGGCRGPTENIKNAIALARVDAWQRGLLTKTPSLCHGIAGNALALGDEEQFSHFLAHMTSEQLEVRGWLADAGHTDRFAGLFGGEAGRAWVWAVADKGLPKTCIGFNDL